MASDIYELFHQVRAHPDFVFGTIFTRADFESPDEDTPAHDPDTFASRHAEDRLVELGNELIEDLARRKP